MLFSIRRINVFPSLSAIIQLRLIALFFLGFAPALQALEINALTIESQPGQALIAQLPIQNAHPNTNLGCFTLQQPPAVDPIHLEYTTLGSQNGVLMLWSNSAISSSVTATLTDHCQHSSLTFTIQPDNSISVTPSTTAPQVNILTKPAVQITNNTEQPIQTPDIPADAYNALQQQIDSLHQEFKQLQTKSDALYASNLAQAGILMTLKHQLTQLQNENHLLRTLVFTLGLALIASGYFFADWLRRHIAEPKTKHHENTKEDHPQSGYAPPKAAYPAEKPDTSTATAEQVAPPTQPPYQGTRVASRLQSVPTHANDDQVLPNGVPLRLSSQQTTNAVMQDASHLFTHGRVNQAIEHLHGHLAKHPKSSPWMWLYLLDLLSKEDKQQEFDIVAGECRKHFNLSVERNPDPKQQGIESFPRVMKAMQQTWGTPQVIALIDDLIYNTRLVPRMGFERSVFEELMLLKEVACQTQNLPTVPPVPKAVTDIETMNDNLRELQKLSGDIYVLTPVDQTPFQYWTDFTFELDEPSTLRKSA
jgi:TolA-binding protein